MRLLSDSVTHSRVRRQNQIPSFSAQVWSQSDTVIQARSQRRKTQLTDTIHATAIVACAAVLKAVHSEAILSLCIVDNAVL